MGSTLSQEIWRNRATIVQFKTHKGGGEVRHALVMRWSRRCSSRCSAGDASIRRWSKGSSA